MAKISFSDGLAIGGAILTIVLLVLDKAGKLKGPALLVLLGVAACMAIPLLLGVSWVADAPAGMPIFARRMLMIFFLGTLWALVSVWITIPSETNNTASEPNTIAPPAMAPITPETHQVPTVDSRKQEMHPNPSPFDKSLPLIVEVKISNFGKAKIVNQGKVPINDLKVDVSSQRVDRNYPPRGQEESFTPRVTGSSYWSDPISVRHDVLEPGESTDYDLKDFFLFDSLPGPADVGKVTAEKMDEMTTTFIVFRFTFRDVRTGERHGCYKIHSSYLKFPSAFNDGVASASAPWVIRFYNRFSEALIGAARERYQDGTKELQCES